MTGTIVQLDTYRRPPRPRVGSQYARYPLPFFNADVLSTWHVKPTGDYAADCATGRRYAIEFLKSCDGTVGWVSLLPAIMADMICAGTSGAWANGDPRVDGVVIGFASVIGRALCILSMTTPSNIALLMEEH
jgi:hypothetical protein